MKIRTIFAAAFIAASGSVAHAATTNQDGFTYDSDPSPFNLELWSIDIDGGTYNNVGDTNAMSVGDVIGGELFNNAESVGGALTFVISADEPLTAVNFSTSNQPGSFEGLVISWCADSVTHTGSTTTCGSTLSSISEPIVGQSLSAEFGQNETLFLVATWDSVNGSASNLDFQITATAIPLPASALLLLGGLGGMAALRRRKKA